MDVFTERISRHLALDPIEMAFIEGLQSKEVTYRRHQTVARAGDPSRKAFVLKSGWAMSFTRSLDGGQQIRRLHFPGDLMGMPSVPMRRHSEDIQTLSEAVIAPFDKRLLARLFELPRVAALMYMFAQAERITAGDRLSSLGSTSAKGRLAFLLLDIMNRLRSVERTPLSSFRLHISREQMAHVVGITPVHASRMWSELIEDGYIASTPPLVTILDEQSLTDLSSYVSRDGDFDHEWLAGVRPLSTGLEATVPPSRCMGTSVSNPARA